MLLGRAPKHLKEVLVVRKSELGNVIPGELQNGGHGLIVDGASRPRFLARPIEVTANFREVGGELCCGVTWMQDDGGLLLKSRERDRDVKARNVGLRHACSCFDTRTAAVGTRRPEEWRDAKGARAEKIVVQGR